MKLALTFSCLFLAQFASESGQACTDTQIHPVVIKTVSDIAKMGEPTAQVSDFHITHLDQSQAHTEGASDVAAFYKLTYQHVDGLHTVRMIGQFKLNFQTCEVFVLRGDETN